MSLSAAVFLIAREKGIAEANFLRAERNSAHAKRYFRDAREVLDQFGVELSERLAEISGAEEVREELLRKSLQYYQGFVEEAQSDMALRADLALTYGKIASLMDEVGSTAESVAAHEKSADLFAELAEREPNADHQRRWALSKNNLALVLRRAGKLDRAKQLFLEAITLQRQLTTQSPGSDDILVDLAASLSNLGLLQNQLKLKKEAQDSYRSAINLLEQLRSGRPHNSDYQYKVAVAYNNLASAYLDAQPAKAITLHLQALDLLLGVQKERSDQRAVTRDVALTLNNLGAAYSRTTHVDESIRSYEQAIEIQLGLAGRAPSHRRYQVDLAHSHNNLGLVLSRVGRTEDAEAAFQQSLKLHEAIFLQCPGDFSLQSSIGGVYNNLGILLEQSQRLEAAADTFEKATDYQRAAIKQLPESHEARNSLDKHFVNYSRVLLKLGRVEEANRLAIRRRELWADNPHRLFRIAEELSKAYSEISNSTVADAAREECAKLALDALAEAIQAGYSVPGDIRQRESFSALSRHPHFVQIVSPEP